MSFCRIALLALALVTLTCGQSGTAARSAPVAKSSMDFWLGDWDVFLEDGQKVGSNRIEKVLSGAAILEHWRDSAGGEGKSWFYWMPDKKTWKQVWVTPDGAYKEKIAEAMEGGLLFTGEAVTAKGQRYPDRTKLTRHGTDEVRQVIEYSADGGKTWTSAFHAVYRRPK